MFELEAQLTALIEEVARIKRQLYMLELELSTIEEGMPSEFLEPLTTLFIVENRLSQVREALKILSERKIENSTVNKEE